MNTNEQEVRGTVPEGMHRISWGAILAGLLGALALLWLLVLLGSALGVSILDATEAAALGSGLGLGAAIWLILSFLIAYFVGGAMAGRLSTDPTSTGGMLHGVTVWSAATVLSLVLGAWGIGGAASVTSHAASDVATASTNVVVETGQSMQMTRELTKAFADSELAAEMAAEIKTRLAELLSSTAQGVGQEQAGQALSEIDAETAAVVSRHLVAGETGQAAQALAEATNLSRSESNGIIDGLESEIEAAIADSAMLNELQAALRAQVDEALQVAADLAGPALTASELRTALDQLDAEILTEIATHLMRGEEDRAGNVLTSNTSLDEREVDRVIDEMTAKFEQQMKEWRQQADEVMEAAADYTQMAVWSLFLASLLALLAAVSGGRVGAMRIRQ